MLKIYGSMLCKDCVACCKDLTEAGTPYKFLDFADDLQNLKDFMKIRDKSELFDPFRGEGKLGIPCIVKEDGSVTLEWEDLK